MKISVILLKGVLAPSSSGITRMMASLFKEIQQERKQPPIWLYAPMTPSLKLLLRSSSLMMGTLIIMRCVCMCVCLCACGTHEAICDSRYYYT